MKQVPWLLAPSCGLDRGETVVLDPGEARHATGPLRLKTGDRVLLTDGRGAVASGVLGTRVRGRLEVMIEFITNQPRPPDGLTLAVSVLAGSAMDLVIQKAVELGVSRVAPVCAQRSQFGPPRAIGRMDHWRRLAEQATKQCRRPWFMDLLQPMVFSDLVAGEAGPGGVVAHRDGKRVREIPADRRGLLVIGPEGGFTADEEQELDRAGWPRVSLGRHVLRAETAAIAGAALLGDRLEMGLQSSDV